MNTPTAQLRSPAELARQVREEFAEARRITTVSWSEREVLEALGRAEAIALRALGAVPQESKKNIFHLK